MSKKDDWAEVDKHTFAGACVPEGDEDLSTAAYIEKHTEPAEPDDHEPLFEQDLMPEQEFSNISILVDGDFIEIPQVLGWKVLMRPRRTKTATDWGFELADKDSKQEAYANYVSQILAVGEGCFMARDQGGVDMSKFEKKPKVGDWVIHTPYSGYRIRMRGMTEVDYLIVMDDTEIHCVVNNPDDYYGVIDVSSR